MFPRCLPPILLLVVLSLAAPTFAQGALGTWWPDTSAQGKGKKGDDTPTRPKPTPGPRGEGDGD